MTYYLIQLAQINNKIKGKAGEIIHINITHRLLFVRKAK